jgi:hypothetical protein
MSMRLVSCVLSAVASAGTGELLLNPSYEDIEGDMPAHWRLFVEPMEGARGAVDVQACDGARSAMLYNPARYAVEPANNWSQNLLEPLGGKTLVVSGSIKTQDADEAALWVQCYRKKPWAVLEHRTSGEDTPVRGTLDWTPVTLRVDVPRGTDFVVLRCVLKGRGTAWFDRLSIICQEPAPKPSLDSAATPSLPKPVEPPSVPTVAPPASTKGGEADAQQSMMQAQDALRKATESLRENNEALAAQLKAMQAELDRLREQTRRFSEEAGNVRVDAPPEKEVPVRTPVPPLVPHEPEPQGKP